MLENIFVIVLVSSLFFERVTFLDGGPGNWEVSFRNSRR